MDIEEATLRGREAFKAGRKCVPALDPGFTAEACAGGGDAATVADLLGAWLRGWTLENVAAPVVGMLGDSQLARDIIRDREAKV